MIGGGDPPLLCELKVKESVYGHQKSMEKLNLQAHAFNGHAVCIKIGGLDPEEALYHVAGVNSDI